MSCMDCLIIKCLVLECVGFPEYMQWRVRFIKWLHTYIRKAGAEDQSAPRHLPPNSVFRLRALSHRSVGFCREETPILKHLHTQFGLDFNSVKISYFGTSFLKYIICSILPRLLCYVNVSRSERR